MAVNSLANTHQNNHWKLRRGPAGLHLFNRTTGQNILVDEMTIQEQRTRIRLDKAALIASRYCADW